MHPRMTLLSAGLCLLSAPVLAAEDVTTVPYLCDHGARVSATYINSGTDSFAVVTFEGRQIGFAIAQSASGARYESRDAAQPFVWWSKGDQAMMLFGAEETPVYSECVPE